MAPTAGAESLPPQSSVANSNTTVPNHQGAAGAAPGAGLSPATRAHFLPEPEDGWPTVHGITQARLLKGIRPASLRDWRTYEGTKVLAVVERSRINFQTTELVAIVEDILKVAFPRSPRIDVCPGAPADERLQAYHPFPVVVAGLSEAEAATLLAEFCLANERRAVFFYPFNAPLPPSSFAVAVENIAFQAGPENDVMAAEAIVKFLSTAGEIAEHIAKHNDAIPFDNADDGKSLVDRTLATLKVVSTSVRRREGGTHLHQVYITPPSRDPDAHREWITLLSGLTYSRA